MEHAELISPTLATILYGTCLGILLVGNYPTNGARTTPCKPQNSKCGKNEECCSNYCENKRCQIDGIQQEYTSCPPPCQETCCYLQYEKCISSYPNKCFCRAKNQLADRERCSGNERPCKHDRDCCSGFCQKKDRVCAGRSGPRKSQFDLSPTDLRAFCQVVDPSTPRIPESDCVYMKWTPCPNARQDDNKSCGWYKRTKCDGKSRRRGKRDVEDVLTERERAVPVFLEFPGHQEQL